MQPSIRYLILALTRRCNLRCAYCYNGRAQAAADMPEPVMRQAIHLAASGGAPFHLQLTGGEPTLVPAAIEKAAMLAQETGRCRSMGIQTNGTLLDPRILGLLKRYAFQVGVSLDGPPSIQQRQRGMAGDTFRGLGQLDAAGIPFRVTTVVTRESVLHLDRLVLTLAGFSRVRGIGLDLLIRKGRAEDGNSAKPADPPALENGLRSMLAVLREVNARRRHPIRLREADLIADSGKKRQPFCHVCTGQSMAVDPAGRCFPCGQTLGDPRFAAGTVRNPDGKRLRCLQDTRPGNASCSQCALVAACPGDCPSRLHYNRLADPSLVCVVYRTIMEENEKRTHDCYVARSHRPPARR